MQDASIPNKKEVSYSPDLKFISEYEDCHIPNRLYVDWDITTKCNFKCSYCYARKEYKDDWNKTDTYKRQELIIQALKLRKLPLFLDLLGGEPTLHPNFLGLVDDIHRNLIQGDLERLYITTNGSTNIIKKIKEYPNTSFVWSLHLEHKDRYGARFEKFFDNLKISVSKGFTNYVTVLLIPNIKYYNDYKFIFDELKKLDKVEIHPAFLYDFEANKPFCDYATDFFERFSFLKDIHKNYIFETSDSFVRLSYFDIIKYNLNHFKGWKCHNNNIFEISYDGILQRICEHEQVDICSNPFYFKNLTLKPMTCPWETCDCDGKFTMLKTKEF